MQMPPSSMPDSGDGTLTLAVRPNPETGRPELAMVLPEHGLELSFDAEETAALVEDLEQLLLQMRTILAQWFEAEVPGTSVLHLVPASVFEARLREPQKEHWVTALCGLRQERAEEWLLEPLDEDAQPCLEHTCVTCLSRYHGQQAQAGAARG